MDLVDVEQIVDNNGQLVLTHGERVRAIALAIATDGDATRNKDHLIDTASSYEDFILNGKKEQQ